jgi:hypothetical protein
MKNILFFSIPALLLQGCQGENSQSQDISDEKIARIMADLYIAEAATIGMTGYSKDSLMQVYYNQVFEMHGTDKVVYENNLRLISNDLQHLKQVVLEARELLEEKGGN